MVVHTIVNGNNLKKEGILDASIQFDATTSENWIHPRAILLTGATGLVGVYLLDELLHKTTADIYCIIRCNNPDDGKKRLITHLQTHLLWQEKYSSRIIPVMGDLSKPLLGLSTPVFQELADKIDRIYHSGAFVNFMFPYSVLKAANVLGTQEIIRLSALYRLKPLHFVSSVAVFFSQTHFDKKIVNETDIPNLDESFKGGYKQSKWVAEQLLMDAQKRGLPSAIYRPVRILGSSKTGILKLNDDSLCHLLKACIEIGKYPTLDTLMTFVPVDYVSQAIVQLSLQKKSINKAFHLTHPNPIPWKSFMNEICAFGYDLQEIPYNQWIEELKTIAATHPENKVYSFLLLFLRDSNNLLLKQMHFDSTNTMQDLKGTPISCPPTDQKLVSRYLSYFQQSGYIPKHSGS
ncbi:MAG: thioester reductase domain-containing protein [Desulfobacterales bacterium]|nr:thioester reductase domain-containing protein [Desulfobacterales bacterium]